MYISIYANKVPDLIFEIADTPEMQRLSDVGMHCGCEYAGFPIYQQVKSNYTRLMHSIGVASIVWNFTQDIKQTVAGLLHDISTPTFAHAIDFLNGDYVMQESTEDKTSLFIKKSKSIAALLESHGIEADDVGDYHKYPIADNDTPMLSADRLEYTFGNGYIVHKMSLHGIQDIYDDLAVVKNENNIDELCFESMALARKFVALSLKNSYWFVSDEDRFSMQYLADMIQYAIQKNILSFDDLYTTESNVILKLRNHETTFALWEGYTKISAVSASDKKDENSYCVNVSVKKRYIDPLVIVENTPKRISDVDESIKEKFGRFLSLDFNRWISAK